jgi:hypothetical protein
MLTNKAFLAGLFTVAAGVAVVYFTLREPEEEEVAPEPTPIVVREAPFLGPRTKSDARAALAALPEVKAWNEHLETSSGGTTKGALIEYGPTPKLIGSKRYWQFSYVENTPEAAHRWESFLVGQDTPEILVEDDETDAPMTLEQWRKDKQPLARKSAL